MWRKGGSAHGFMPPPRQPEGTRTATSAGQSGDGRCFISALTKSLQGTPLANMYNPYHRLDQLTTANSIERS